MTKAYVVLKDLDGKNAPIIASKNDQLILSEESATELDFAGLETKGLVRYMTDGEALSHYKGE